MFNLINDKKLEELIIHLFHALHIVWNFKGMVIFNKINQMYKLQTH